MIALKYGVAAVSALLAASLVPLLSLASERVTAAGPAAAEAPLEVPSFQRESAAPEPLPPAAVVAAAPAPAAAPRPASGQKDAFRDWSRSIARLPQDLGRMGPSLKLALDDARNHDMAFCFREVEQGALDDGRPHTIRSSNLMLYLESREGVVDVVDAQVAHPGTLPPSVVDCAREVLRGLEVKVFFGSPGERYSYIYEIEA